ncbi:hypothetical protein [Paenibacillus sp. IHBB 3054]|uniref:hypothetical protein n=1 Tax=Paenibacillus sp. IHBB 3054 TaxID=3425689 RepID=UPI003F663A41
MRIELNAISTQAVNEIKELAIFAEASKYIYQHFTSTAEDIRDVEIKPNVNYGVSVEELIEQISNGTITNKLYENVIVRAYGTLEVYIQKVVSLIINENTSIFLKGISIPLTTLIDGDIDKLIQGYINRSVFEKMSNKNMYDAISSVLKTLNVDLGLISVHESDVRDIYALRNLIAHKNCEIDSKFLEIYSHNSSLVVGEKLKIEYENMTSVVNRINKFMSAVHKTVARIN